MKTALPLALLLGIALPAQAAPLKVLTEAYPHYSEQVGSEIHGAGADQVHLMMAKAEIPYTMAILPWARAYAMTIHDRNTCLFATNHTPERDRLFQWIEPLGAGNVVLIRKAGSKIAPKTEEEAKAYTIGVQRADYAADYLAKRGFKKLDQATDFNLTLKKLMSGRIDLAMTTDGIFNAEVARGQGLEMVLTMPAAFYALACSLDVPKETVVKLRGALKDIILDGTQDRIYEKYGLPAQKLQSFVQKND
nr:transporter substrate-binding domain-containing protein [uncultured Gellertiella sp.]